MRSPLKEHPLRHPGQSLDLNTVVFAALEWSQSLLDLPPSPVLYSIFALIAVVFAAIKVRAIFGEIQSYKLGRDGEKVVGQQLELLRETGAKVHHDICADNFNIDHLVVSSKGVFVIETKTWSKPEKGNEQIRFDGKNVFKFGHAVKPNPVTQAVANAQFIRALLKQSTGREFDIQPILAFPGWFVEKQPNLARFEPWVLNPKVIPSFIKNTKPMLSEEDVHLISYHIERYVLAAENA